MKTAISLALLLCGLAGSARAHAVLVDSTPPIRGTVPAGHAALTLRFNSRIDRDRSRLTLIMPDRTQARLPIGGTGPADSLSAAADLPPGAYTVRWQVLAVDGHITRGDMPFTVTQP